MDQLDINLERVRIAVNNRLSELKTAASPKVSHDESSATPVQEVQEKSQGWWLNWKPNKS